MAAMLSDRWYRLLTGYVDGVLSARERRAVESLLQRSPEARSLLEKLQQDAERLRRLPRVQLGTDLAEKVLKELGDRSFRQVQPVQVPRVAGLAWNRWAVAAGLILAAGGGSILYWAGSAETENGRAAATIRERARSTIPQEPDGRERPPVAAASNQAEPDEPADALVSPDGANGQAELPKDPKNKVTGDANLGAEADALVVAPTPLMEMFPELPDLRLAVIFQLRDLNQPGPEQRLHDLVHKETACRIEMNCLASLPALQRLKSALLYQGVRLLVDQAAQDRLRRRLRTNYVVYTENVAPAELTRVFFRLSEEDRQAESSRRGAGQFERVVANPMQTPDRQELSRLLGADPSKLQPNRPKTPLGVDISKPLADQTADQVVKSLRGQGSPTERLAIVLPYNPVRPHPTSSKEVKRFLDSRKEPNPGTVQVLLVLRPKLS
jgi:hypothetical protein